jgi:hypothetical protein
MRITKIETFDADQLMASLREVRLMGFDGRVRPYADAHLKLVSASPDDLVPAQNYLLQRSIDGAHELRDALLEHGLDVFVLEGGAWVTAEGDGAAERFPVIPPIVEESHEPDGRIVWLINDGLHRVYAAREQRSDIAVVRISGLSREYPYYAEARADGWAGIPVFDELPDGYQKKQYRVPTAYKSLYRDFNAVFPGIQPERKDSNPPHLTA